MVTNDKFYRKWDEEAVYFEEGIKKDHGMPQST
jgi:hypothetical protein